MRRVINLFLIGILFGPAQVRAQTPSVTDQAAERFNAKADGACPFVPGDDRYTTFGQLGKDSGPSGSEENLSKITANDCDAPASPARVPTPDRTSFIEAVCSAIAREAMASNLPAEFFTKLIWQESRFNPRARSYKGAEGIAQFMPGTARWRGLEDSYDPFKALHKSARWLAELRDQFGNVGLAAAAYNAGPGRIRSWLSFFSPRLNVLNFM
jgi:hypothetical protein